MHDSQRKQKNVKLITAFIACWKEQHMWDAPWRQIPALSVFFLLHRSHHADMWCYWCVYRFLERRHQTL